MSEENVRITAEIKKGFLEKAAFQKRSRLQKWNSLYQTTAPKFHTTSNSSMTLYQPKIALSFLSINNIYIKQCNAF